MSTNKKAKVSNFAFANAGLSEEQAHLIWGSLQRAIEEVQNGNASKLRYEELYRNAYTLVLHKHGELLYTGVTQAVRAKLEEVATVVTSAPTDSLLEVIVAQWDRHKTIMQMIRDILMYMDKTFCKQQKKMTIYDMGLLLFRDCLLHGTPTSHKLRRRLLDKVAMERAGEVVDRVVLKHCLAMLVEANVSSTELYHEVFEEEFLAGTRAFYKQEAQDLIASVSCPLYLTKVAWRLRQEESRADTYLDKSTKPKLRALLQEELISNYAQRLVNDEQTGGVAMLRSAQTEDLARLYGLLSREPHTLKHLKEVMATIVKDVGSLIVRDKDNLKNPTLFVQQVLDTRKKFHSLVHDAFNQDRNFARALKEALEYFINLDGRAAQYLSLYIDELLRSKARTLPAAPAADPAAPAASSVLSLPAAADDLEDTLEHVMSIFRYLQDKDVFEDYYKHHLAARLLSGQSTNAEVEKLMISKLKAECGQQFTSRLEGMFKDMELSKQLMSGYKDWAQKQGKAGALGLDLSVQVLTTGFWPIPNIAECKLPRAAALATDHFRTYYTHLHSGRRLAWQTNLGTAEVRARFDKGKKELQLHTYQMCILMLFNHADQLTFKEIQDQTHIPEAEAVRHVLSLAHPKVRVLRKEPNTKQLEPHHVFHFNKDYASSLFKVKIPLLSTKAIANDHGEGGGGAGPSGSGSGSASGSVATGAPGDDHLPAAVFEARKNRVEAAVVRVMKSRKTLDHSSLIAEVTKQLSSRFAVEPTFIKKRIEGLLEREYLERDKENRRLYHYVA